LLEGKERKEMKRFFAVLAALALACAVGAGCKYFKGAFEEGIERVEGGFKINLSAEIDAPLEDVYDAFNRPEDLEKHSEQYQETKLVKSEGMVKVVDYRVSTLGRVQSFTMELTMVPAEHKVKIKTIKSSLADITGEYRLEPAPGGKGTIVYYTADQKDLRNIPFPVSVQKTAIKEAFDNLIAGIKKGLQEEGKLSAG